MSSYGEKSNLQFVTLHPDLQKILLVTIKIFDHSTLEGHRGKEKQNGYFETGASKLKWPEGKHNKWPSQAVDLQPYPKFLPDKNGKRINVYSVEGSVRFYFLIGIITGVAHNLGIAIRWGGDWNRDQNPHNEKWDDFPHLELYKARPLTAQEKAHFLQLQQTQAQEG